MFINFRPSCAISMLSMAISLASDFRSGAVIFTGKQRVADPGRNGLVLFIQKADDHIAPAFTRSLATSFSQCCKSKSPSNLPRFKVMLLFFPMPGMLILLKS